VTISIQDNAQCHYAEGSVLFIIMPNVIYVECRGEVSKCVSRLPIPQAS
jgi:hypothetical protein